MYDIVRYGKIIMKGTTSLFWDCNPKACEINEMITQKDKNSKIEKSPLGNREVGKRSQNIYLKYLRKQIASFALTVGNRRVSSSSKKLDKSKLKKVQFQDALSFAKTLKSINKSLCSCGRDTHFCNESGTVELKKVDNSKRLKGLKSCGNNASCPVCASKLSFVRGSQLKEYIEVGRKNKRSYIMIVVTIPHKPLESLETTLNQVIDMPRYIFNTRQWKEFKKITKFRFVSGGLENTVSFKNGQVDWHPHKNYLLDFDIPINEVIKILGLENREALQMYISSMLTTLGQKYLDSKNIKKTLLVPFFEQSKTNNRLYLKGGITASLEFDDAYIAKWGLSAEMTAGVYKDGRFNGGSMHPFGLLDLIDSNNKQVGEKQRYQAIMAFQEFVVASRGKHWFYFGKGAIDYYNKNYGSKIKVKKDEEELQAFEDKGDVLAQFDFEEWFYFEPNAKKIYEALSCETDEATIRYFRNEIETNRYLSQLLNNKSFSNASGEIIEYCEIIYEEYKN